MVHGLSLATITGRWLGETPFVQVSMTCALTCPEKVHHRPCMTREIETWLSDSRVGNNSVVDHISQRPVLSPLCNCVAGWNVWLYCSQWHCWMWDPCCHTAGLYTGDSWPSEVISSHSHLAVVSSCLCCDIALMHLLLLITCEALHTVFTPTATRYCCFCTFLVFRWQWPSG